MVRELWFGFEKLKPSSKSKVYLTLPERYRCPRYIKTIGIVTSPTGAALKDILSVFQRRCAGLFVKISPATVQGKDAAASIISALNLLEREFCDVVIVCRGGGSSEDLWVFNDESLVMAVSKCKTPVISAIGHEIDYTLCDLVLIRAASQRLVRKK
jgi:exodeoxyribonuclease VII large subunit